MSMVTMKKMKYIKPLSEIVTVRVADRVLNEPMGNPSKRASQSDAWAKRHNVWNEDKEDKQPADCYSYHAWEED